MNCSFLQNQSAWIFFPTEVEFEISTDGFDYSSVKRFQHKTEISPGHEVIDFSHVFSQEKARFVKVKAKNITICPDWHPGAGGKAWLFADEIVVK
jgi:hexosaminidase